MIKNLRILTLVMVSTVVFVTNVAFALETDGENEIKISGEMWMGIHMNLTKDHGEATDLQLDKFQLNFDKKVSDMFTAAIKIEKVGVSNVNSYITSDSGEKVYVGNVGFGMYLKEATIKATPVNGPLSVYFVGGIPETPTGQFVENLKGDYMFNMHEEEFTERFTNEKKYDAAVGVGFKYNKLIDAYFTMGHGDGYKNLGGKNAPDYKYSYNARITISPIESLKISGFSTMDNHKPQDEWLENNEETILEGAFAKNASTAALQTGISTTLTGAGVWNNGDFNGDGYANSSDYVDGLLYLSSVNTTFAGYKNGIIEAYADSADVKGGFLGGGIAWSDDSIRIGFNYFYLKQKISGDKSEVDGDQVFDLWANTNLNRFIGLPFAIYTGYSYMKDKNTKNNGVSVEEEGKAVDITEWFVGAGYEFSGEAGMYIFYRELDEDISSFDTEKDVKIVGTLKF